MNNKIDLSEFQVYPQSIQEVNGCTVFMSNDYGHDVLISIGDDLGFTGDNIKSEDICYLRAELSHVNAVNLRRLFPYTAPRLGLASERSLGVGDRLGLACPGHIRALAQYDAFPIFAQQSVRELTLTERTYEDVLDSVTFAVFRAGFKRGFGADGDHLKKPEEIEYALRCGFTMITLDCSEHIRNDINAMTDEQIKQILTDTPDLDNLYLNRSFEIGPGMTLTFSTSEFRRMILIYGQAIKFVSDIYEQYIKDKPVDFEISIDETITPTTPLQHFFVANELNRRGIKFATLAPRFCGEFQKGVDYIGDLHQFEQDFAMHVAIADHFDYKISVHSGSDKFSIFPIVGRLSNGRFHLKTAGTNWLEAVKLVSIKAPHLYREIHHFALKAFPEARKYYHVTTDLDRIPAIEKLADDKLPGLFDLNDARQLIHITYGLILTARNADGSFLFRTRLYDFWQTNAKDYARLLELHIGKHLSALYSSL